MKTTRGFWKSDRMFCPITRAARRGGNPDLIFPSFVSFAPFARHNLGNQLSREGREGGKGKALRLPLQRLRLRHEIDELGAVAVLIVAFRGLGEFDHGLEGRSCW